MRYATVMVAAVILVGGVIGVVALVMHTPKSEGLEQPVATAARPDEFRYQALDGSKLEDFNLSMRLTLSSPQDRVRVLVNSTDEKNAYYVDFAAESISAGSFESGIARQLCTVPASLVSDKPHDVLIKRRTPVLSVVVDGKLKATVQDETHAYGKVRVGGIGGSVDSVRIQPVADIYFADSFMQDAEEESHWTKLRGKWTVNVKTNPTMSANAFYYLALSDGVGSTVTGESFWDNYSFRTAFRSNDGQAVGMYLYYRDEKNYYLFTWDRRDDKTPTEARKRLVKVHEGQRTVLAEAEGGYLPDQWYALEVEADGDTLRASIDDNPVFAVRDENLVSGMVGLYVDRTTETQFDDVFVRTVRSVRDDLRDFPGGRWTVLGGTWESIPAGENGAAVQVRSAGMARSVTGSAAWRNYAVRTQIEPGSAARCGLNLFYLDETTFYSVACVRSDKGDTWQLVRRRDGKDEVICQKQTDRHLPRYMVDVSGNRGRVAVNVNGSTVLETFERSPGYGAVGLWTEGSDATRFFGLEIDFPRETAPLMAENEVFEHERSMDEWSGVQSDWSVVDDQDGHKLNWHRADFPGTSTLEVKVDQFDKPTSGVTLVLSGDGKSVESGYRLEVGAVGAVQARSSSDGPERAQVQLAALTAAKTPARSVVLYRQEREVARAQLAPDVQPVSVALQRTGDFVVAFVDGQALVYWPDPQPIKGDRLGWWASDCKVNLDEVSLSSPNVYQYTFNQAPADWRTFGGVWEVTNRWECDPRWSFFSGSSRTNELAVLWNKRLFPGDTTVEFYVGPKMDQARGKAYEYVADFNCTLNADGRDLTSGYSFLVGGFNDSKSGIYRNNVPVGKPSSTVIPRSSDIHRKWFHIRAQNKGGKVSLWLDGKLLCEYQDPDPLKGDRLAIWTYNNKFMLARIMISSADGSRLESPDFEVGPRCASVYDQAASASR